MNYVNHFELKKITFSQLNLFSKLQEDLLTDHEVSKSCGSWLYLTLALRGVEEFLIEVTFVTPHFIGIQKSQRDKKDADRNLGTENV